MDPITMGAMGAMQLGSSTLNYLGQQEQADAMAKYRQQGIQALNQGLNYSQGMLSPYQQMGLGVMGSLMGGQGLPQAQPPNLQNLYAQGGWDLPGGFFSNENMQGKDPQQQLEYLRGLTTDGGRGAERFSRLYQAFEPQVQNYMTQQQAINQASQPGGNPNQVQRPQVPTLPQFGQQSGQEVLGNQLQEQANPNTRSFRPQNPQSVGLAQLGQTAQNVGSSMAQQQQGNFQSGYSGQMPQSSYVQPGQGMPQNFMGTPQQSFNYQGPQRQNLNDLGNIPQFQYGGQQPQYQNNSPGPGQYSYNQNLPQFQYGQAQNALQGTASGNVQQEFKPGALTGLPNAPDVTKYGTGNIPNWGGFDLTKYGNDPLRKQMMSDMQRSVEGSAAANGMLHSGNTLKALQDNAAAIGAKYYQDARQNALQDYGIGQGNEQQNWQRGLTTGRNYAQDLQNQFANRMGIADTSFGRDVTGFGLNRDVGQTNYDRKVAELLGDQGVEQENYKRRLTGFGIQQGQEQELQNRNLGAYNIGRENESTMDARNVRDFGIRQGQEQTGYNRTLGEYGIGQMNENTGYGRVLGQLGINNQNADVAFNQATQGYGLNAGANAVNNQLHNDYFTRGMGLQGTRYGQELGSQNQYFNQNLQRQGQGFGQDLQSFGANFGAARDIYGMGRQNQLDTFNMQNLLYNQDQSRLMQMLGLGQGSSSQQAGYGFNRGMAMMGQPGIQQPSIYNAMGGGLQDIGNMMMLNQIMGSGGGGGNIPSGGNNVGYDPRTLANNYINKGLGFNQ